MAANALSDVDAMGGRPSTAMNIVGIPEDKLRPATVAEILAGGAEVVMAAGAVVVGGHTIRNPEPIYGLSVTGIVALDGCLRACPKNQFPHRCTSQAGRSFEHARQDRITELQGIYRILDNSVILSP